MGCHEGIESIRQEESGMMQLIKALGGGQSDPDQMPTKLEQIPQPSVEEIEADPVWQRGLLRGIGPDCQ